VQNEFFRHTDRVQILTIADLAQHVRYTGGTGLFKG
jgi:hypothetical protein